MKRNLFYGLLGLLLFAGCGKDSGVEKEGEGDGPTPEEITLELSVSDLVFEAAGGVKTFGVACNGEWKIEGAGEWCVVDTDAGNGNRTVSVTAAAYEGMEDRNVNLTVKVGDKAKVVGVTQKRKDAVVLSKDKLEVPQDGGTLSVEVKSNIDYEVTVPEEFGEWISLLPDSKAVENRTYRFAIGENDMPESRRGYIVFAGNAVKDTVYVYQAQKDRLLLEQDSYDAAVDGETFSVELKTNVDYEVKIPADADWVSRVETRALRTDRLTFAVAANEGYDSRSAKVVIQDRNGHLDDTLYLRQFGKAVLLLDKVNIDVPAVGGTVSVEARSNVEYEIVIPEDFDLWISRVPETRALTAKVFNFRIGRNSGYDSRTGYIVFTSSVSNDTVFIRQEANKYLRWTQNRFTLRAAGKDLTVELRTNIAYEVEIPAGADWVSRVETRALETNSLQFRIGANSGDARSAKIAIKGVDNPLTDTLYLTQQGSEIAPGDEVEITADFDPAFAKVLQEKGYIPDAARIILADVKYINSLVVSGRSLTSLKGIGHFAALTYLDCSSNQLTTLDMSKNLALVSLNCSNGGYNAKKLTSLDVSKNSALEVLDCSGNQLTSLDVSRSPALTYLDCSNGWGLGQNSLTSLDVSHNPALEVLNCSNNNLKSLDVSRNPALVRLDCSNSMLFGGTKKYGQNSLTSLDLSYNPALEELNCFNNNLKALDVSKNPALVRLNCSNDILDYTTGKYGQNSLTSLDVSHNTVLTYLNCSGNPGQNGVFVLTVWPEENNRLPVLSSSWTCFDGQEVFLQKQKGASIGKGDIYGDTYTETVSGVSFDMVYVQGGTFRMGATEEQGLAYNSNEKPVHSVTLSDYYIGKHEVTQGLWKAVMGTTLEEQRDKAGASSFYGVGDNYPMYYVSWDEAQEFVRKLSELTGKKYVLPTEAQWEYAARGGAKSKGYKYSGSNTIDDVAWYWGNSEEKNSTSPVGTKSPNELGIYDMSGNVCEWCSDRYGSYSDASQTNPAGPESGFRRVLRGGSWRNYARDCRVSYRGSGYPYVCDDLLGFRVALAL